MDLVLRNLAVDCMRFSAGDGRMSEEVRRVTKQWIFVVALIRRGSLCCWLFLSSMTSSLQTVS